jgi:hypothetical protein
MRRRGQEFAIIGDSIEDCNTGRVVGKLTLGLPLSYRTRLQDALSGRKAWERGFEEGERERNRPLNSYSVNSQAHKQRTKQLWHL